MENPQDIIEFLSHPLGIAAAFVFTIFVFFRYIQSDQFFSWFERKDKNRIAELERYLTQDVHHKENHQLVQDMREAHYFKKATGLDVDVEWITPLIEFHQSLQGKIRWKQIHFAQEFLEFNQNQISISSSLHSFWRQVDFGIQVGMAFGMLLLSFLLLTLAALAFYTDDNFGVLPFLLSIVGSVVGTGFSVLITRGAKDIVSARQIDKALKEIQKDSKNTSKTA